LASFVGAVGVVAEASQLWGLSLHFVVDGQLPQQLQLYQFGLLFSTSGMYGICRNGQQQQ
jgi:hypothetical protein